MKLSKEDLKRLVWHSQAGLTDCDSLAWLELIDGILNGRYDEPLEIEGYERSGWTKFDSDNPKTFPEHGSLILMCRKDGVVCFGHFFDGDEKRSYWGHEVTHWQPLPNPPAETEVQQ